jgi:Ca2+-transporting ATPase
VNIAFFVYMLGKYPIELTVTTIFTSMAFSQWINGIHAQKEKEPFFMNLKSSFTINPYIWLGALIGLVLQALVVYIMNDWFETVPLGIEHIVLVISSAIIIFLLIEGSKWLWYIVDNITLNKKMINSRKNIL